MSIRHELLESLRARLAGRPAPRVAQVIRPPGGSAERVSPFTVVVLDNGVAGVCWNLLEDEQARAAYDRLELERAIGRDALELGADLLHAELVHRLPGYAAVNALSQVLFAAGEPTVDTTTDLLDLLQLKTADRVGVVGDAPPLVREIADRAGEVVLLERRGARSLRNVQRTDQVEDLAECNKVLVSSSTLLDDSFEAIARITARASFRALYGPGAGILPDAIFARGFQAVAGTRVLDGATLAQRQRDGERWGDAKCKFVATPA